VRGAPAPLRFTSRLLELDVVRTDTAFTRACAPGAAPDGADEGQLRLRIPAKHAWGRYYADADTLTAMEEAGQVVLRYAPGQNFNGSLHDIAGVRNARGNVFGLMPHPEHAVDELTGGSADGLRIFESMRSTIEAAALA
jgi:phosphoribosylformylglycinamidine synthase